MMELLDKAWSGWEKYIQEGMFPALLIGALFFVWFCNKVEQNKKIWLYTTVLAVCCICPLTAAVLMGYQTQFYDYQWIWSAVPMTAMTACGIVLFLEEQWTGAKGNRKRTAAVVTLGLAVVLLLCGGLGRTTMEGWLKNDEKLYREQSGPVLERLAEMAAAGRENTNGENAAGGSSGAEAAEIVLWAPASVLEYAREYSGEIKLLYGRNMWDKALNGYSYDLYSDEVKTLYTRMELWANFRHLVDADKQEAELEAALPIGVGGDAGIPGGNAGAGQNAQAPTLSDRIAYYVGVAVREGVNTIVLPRNVDAATLQEMAKVLGATPELVEEYWILYGPID